jgi:hypothetical protein
LEKISDGRYEYGKDNEGDYSVLRPFGQGAETGNFG